MADGNMSTGRSETRQPSDFAQTMIRNVADGVCGTANMAAATVRQASDGVTEFRAVIRKQPITMAFLMLAMGYVIGSRLTSGRR